MTFKPGIQRSVAQEFKLQNIDNDRPVLQSIELSQSYADDEIIRAPSALSA